MKEVYDLETLFACFTYTGLNIETKKISKFVISDNRDDSKALLDHLNQLTEQIGYNNVSFDYPIIHYFLSNIHQWIYDKMDSSEICLNLYRKAQELIETQNKGFSLESKFNGIREKDYFIPQIDLFKIWHFNNKARLTSLKALEISMNYPNVMEMPIIHNKMDISDEEIEDILKYNLNDVLATYAFYLKTVELGKIDLRNSIQRKFGLPCMNWNNGKIGENLILKLYCQKTGRDYWEVRKSRSNREEIALKDCIPSIIKFESNEFNSLLEFFRNSVIKSTKGSLDFKVNYKGLKYIFGLGGIHAAIESNVYVSDNKYIIKSCDVASLYPNLPIVFIFFPEHLGIEFLDVYKDNIVDIRMNEKKKSKDEQDSSIIDGFKEAANVPYGKSNEKFSFLYDPLFTMKTTIAGQLVLTMLCERLSKIEDSQILMVNTDGLEIRIPRDKEEEYYSICKEWEKEIKLTLEFQDYEKIWIGDINNYGCINTEGKIKNKGRFEVDKKIGNEPAYHKDNSFRIIPLALQEYFSKGIPPEDTIFNHRDIYDFCGRQKFKGQDYGETHTIILDKGVPIDKIEKQQKNTRYYISKPGSAFIKKYAKGTEEKINKGFEVTIFNQYIEKPFKEYNIDYNFYIQECYKEKYNIQTNQLTLF